MVIRRLIAPNIDFSALRRELRLPTQFSPAAQREADEVAARGPADPPAAATTATGANAGNASGVNRASGAGSANGAIRTGGANRTDRTDIEFVTLDPPTSMDLDQ